MSSRERADSVEGRLRESARPLLVHTVPLARPKAPWTGPVCCFCGLLGKRIEEYGGGLPPLHPLTAKLEHVFSFILASPYPSMQSSLKQRHIVQRFQLDGLPRLIYSVEHVNVAITHDSEARALRDAVLARPFELELLIAALAKLLRCWTEASVTGNDLETPPTLMVGILNRVTHSDHTIS